MIDNPISENMVQDDDTSKIVTKNTTRELYPCLYCNVSYGGIGGLKRHLHYCSKNPDESKNKKIMEDNISKSKTTEIFPCLFCDLEFANVDKLNPKP